MFVRWKSTILSHQRPHLSVECLSFVLCCGCSRQMNIEVLPSTSKGAFFLIMQLVLRDVSWTAVASIILPLIFVFFHPSIHL